MYISLNKVVGNHLGQEANFSRPLWPQGYKDWWAGRANFLFLLMETDGLKGKEKMQENRENRTAKIPKERTQVNQNK